jgi:hypothetical protein
MVIRTQLQDLVAFIPEKKTLVTVVRKLHVSKKTSGIENSHFSVPVIDHKSYKFCYHYYYNHYHKHELLFVFFSSIYAVLRAKKLVFLV